MFGLRVTASIDTSKYNEFIKSIGSHSPQSPLSFFHDPEDPADQMDEPLINIITESNSLKPLTDYIQTESFKTVVELINKLGSVEGIKMEQYSESS